MFQGHVLTWSQSWKMSRDLWGQICNWSPTFEAGTGTAASEARVKCENMFCPLSLLSATHAFPCLALTHRDIFVDHFRLAMATEHNLPAVLRHFYNNPWHCLKHLSPIVDLALLPKRRNKWNWFLMHVVSVNNLILFFSCGCGHFCPGVVSWWGDIIREGLKKYGKNLRLLPLKRGPCVFF